MDAGKKVFIIGPGFIGWDVLEPLVAEKYTVSALVRQKEHAVQIEKSGATTVLGDLDDKSFISQHVSAHDIVFHTATADRLPSVEAILDGINQRAERGLKTIFVHTSGTGVLDDKVNGELKREKVYRDDRQRKSML